MTDYTALIKEIFNENGLVELLSSDSLSKLNTLINNMLEVNEKMNLTAITEGEEVILKHIADSAAVVKYIPRNARLMDVGTGGGFPALPIAILRPDVNVYGLDSTAKKLKYIDDTAKLLEINNLKTVNARAEGAGKTVNYRERFDVVTARAVSALNVLVEICMPFVKVGGVFISMKGASAPEETEAAKSGVIQLGGSKFEDIYFVLKHGETELNRHLLVSKKIKPTPPSFPRQYNRITKKPL